MARTRNCCDWPSSPRKFLYLIKNRRFNIKNQFNFKQIIQILQPIVIDYISPHLYIVYIYLVRDVFNKFLLIDATDRSKISSDQNHFFITLSLYPFHFWQTLPLKWNTLSFHDVKVCMNVLIWAKKRKISIG